MRAAFTNSLLLDNSGNYGLPINDLAFKGDPMAGSVQALIMSFQSLLTFTYGVISIQGAKTEGLYKQAIIGFLKMPVPYALVIGIVLHALALPLPVFISQPLTYADQSMVAIALLTLGHRSLNIRCACAGSMFTSASCCVFWSHRLSAF